MTQNSRSPTADIIDVFTSIDVPNPGAFRSRNEKWFARYVAKRADWGIDAAGDAVLGGGE